MDVLLVLGPGLNADPDLLAEQAVTAAVELGVGCRVVHAGSAEEVATALAGHTDPAVAVPAVPGLMGTRPESVVWYDLGITDPLAANHLQGRGIWGLVWAIRHAVHRVRFPATRIAYGPGPEQWADVRIPAAAEPAPAGTGPAPVAVLLHGGFWRSQWQADLMDALAVDLARRGWISWNLEYRRPDRHGWAATVADVAAGVTAAAARHDGAPLVLFGHSAGGQLALRLAADSPGITLAVSLAGVLDLTEGHHRSLGDGAVAAALGGTPERLPEVYAAADPFARLPIATPMLLVQGAADSPDLVDVNRRFAAASGAPLLELPGDHFDVISPAATIWAATLAAVDGKISRT